MWKAMVVRSRLAVSIFVLAISWGPAAALARETQPSRLQDNRSAALANQVVTELNSARTRRGLTPLRVAPGLVAAAAQHSRDMAQRGYFDHTSADGSQFWKRVARHYPANGSHGWAVGENLLWSSPGVDAPGALRMWMGSPPHRKNMLDPKWREVGISALHVAAAPGFYKGLEVTIVTADFGVRG
jgi:uncharacterized protein YkwD